MNEDIPRLEVGQWVEDFYGETPGCVEKAYGDAGPYEIRLLAQWDHSTLPQRSGVGFRPMAIPKRFHDQARQIADELWYLLKGRRVR